jgi:hypothetical protein
MKALLKSKTLRQSLAEWTDVDVATYYVAVAIGVAPDPGQEWSDWGGKKWVFWSANPLGESLFCVLDKLAECGVLLKNEDHDQYKWNPAFEWETYNPK